MVSVAALNGMNVKVDSDRTLLLLTGAESRSATRHRRGTSVEVVDEDDAPPRLLAESVAVFGSRELV